MYKLVSKNPVQRFKQGKKLIKAQGGTKTKYAANNLVHAGRDTWGDYLYYDNRTGDLIKASSNPDKLKQEGFAIGNVARTAKELKTNPYISRSLPTGFSKDEIFGFTKNHTFGEYTGKLIQQPKVSVQKKTVPNKSGADTSFLTNDQTQRLLDASANPVKKTSNTPRNPGAYHNIVTWQNKLKDFYEPGTFAADGMWGKNAEAAYQKYLQLVNVPEMSQEEAKVATAPRQVQFINPVNLNSTPIQGPQQTYNRTQVREFLRNKGVNPYNFSGDQRRALRMVLNNQGTDADKDLVQSMGLFKKGGILPSRNAVTRFKNRKFN